MTKSFSQHEEAGFTTSLRTHIPPQSDSQVTNKNTGGSDRVHVGASLGAGFRDRSLIIISGNMGEKWGTL